MKFKNIILALFLVINSLNAVDPTPEEIAKNNENLIILLNGIKESISHYEQLEKEVKTLNVIQLKKSLVLGTSKHLKGYLTIKELSGLSSLSEKFNEKNSQEIINLVPNTINFIFNLILAKSITNKDINFQQSITGIADEIKQELNKKFNINISNTDQASTNNIFLSNNSVVKNILKENTTIQKLINIAKKNPEIVKTFVLYVLSYNLTESSILKKDLEKLILHYNIW